MRLIMPTVDLPFDYLTKGTIYRIDTMNGGIYDQIYFSNTTRVSGIYLRSIRIKKLLRDGHLIFVD